MTVGNLFLSTGGRRPPLQFCFGRVGGTKSGERIKCGVLDARAVANEENLSPGSRWKDKRCPINSSSLRK
jgi:hypothetical protein